MKIQICRDGISARDGDALRDLLRQAGCSYSEIEFVDSIKEPTEGTDDDIIICVLSPELLAEPALDEILLRAISGGHRVVGVWPKEAPTSDAPASLLKYCY